MSAEGTTGLRILLVEDEGLVAMLAEEILLDAGWQVILAMQLEQAIQAANSDRFDVAVLDVNLGGGRMSFPVARFLMESGTPFVFATGYAGDAVLTEFPGYDVIQKPYNPASLLAAVSKAVGAKCVRQE
jgi:DNA-binding response OmpR family regulator